MTRMETFARAYRPMQSRGQLLEGGWMHGPRRRPAASMAPHRFMLAALLALVGARGRSRA